MKLPRFGLKLKIFACCMSLSVLILALNYFYMDSVLRKTTRIGAFMRSNYERYLSFQKALSDGQAAVVDIWATSLRLRTALTADPADAEGAKRAGGESRADLLRQVQEGIVRSVDPEFLLILDSRRVPVAAKNSPFGEAELRSNGFISDVLLGHTKIDVLVEHNRRAWLVNAAPVHRLEDASSPVIGAVIIGHPLDEVFAQYKRTTDIDPKQQVELALIDNQNITASTVPAELGDELTLAAQPEALDHVAEGGTLAPVLKLPDGRFDLFEAVARGYTDTAQGNVGKFLLLRSRASREARDAQIARSNLVVLLVALLLAALVSWWLSIALTRPLQQFIDATRGLAHGQGDLTRRLEVDSDSDEIVELANNLNAMFQNLHELASEVQAASFQVGASSAEISAASKQMLSGASDQATKIESSTAAVTEMSSSIQQVAENAAQGTRVARESSERMQSGIAKLVDTSALIEDTGGKIQALGQSGKRIGNIVDVIRQISEQTSLLALNASIEAAHAGEQGRGFAVVADEVSSLARRVGQSAKDIEGLIATISEQTADAVASMQNVTHVFAEYSQQASHMQSSLQQIVDTIQDTARSVQEQAVASDEIARHMDAVQKIAHEVLSSSQEAVVQGDQLHALALKLEQLVRNFNVEPSQDRPRGGGGGDGVRGLPPSNSPPPVAALPGKSGDRRKVARG